MSNKNVSREEWQRIRNEILVEEKELTRKKDAITAKIRELPRVKMDPSQTFDTARGKETFAQLFGGKTQLFVYHLMLGPGWEEACPSCSFWADHFDSFRYHLPQKDVAFKAISRAPLGEIQKYRERMGWQFDWVSSFGSNFNFELGVSEGEDENPGISVFIREGEDVYQTYFTTGRGLEVINSTYSVLDLVPKGRSEAGLEWPQQWVKRHDVY